MNKNRLMSFFFLTTGAAGALGLLNKYIKIKATSKNITEEPEALCYKWRLGSIHYTKIGSGKPLLLLHDLNFASSGYEWSQVIQKLSHHYTVYCVDLLGCGRSEKPNLTYTNYLYVQMICDFIKSEIGHRTNVITSGESSALAVMACSNCPDLFDQLMLINPNALTDSSPLSGKRAKIYKFFMDLPLVGTLYYYIASSQTMLRESFANHYFFNPYSVKQSYIDHYYESAHLGECPKALFSSMECRFTKFNIVNALKKIDNSIFIIGGEEESNIETIINDYKVYNPAIESTLIPKAKHLPHLECPDKLLNAIHMFFA